MSTELTPTEQRLVQDAEEAELAVTRLLESYTQKVNNNTFMDIPYAQFVADLYAAFDPLSDSYHALIELQLEEANNLRNISESQASTTQTVMIASSVVIIVLMSIVGLLIFRSINTPLSRLRNRIGIIAKDADLTQRVEVEGQDELSIIAKDFNSMVANLHNLVENLVDMVASLSGTARELNDISQAIAGSSQSQEQQT